MLSRLFVTETPDGQANAGTRSMVERFNSIYQRLVSRASSLVLEEFNRGIPKSIFAVDGTLPSAANTPELNKGSIPPSDFQWERISHIQQDGAEGFVGERCDGGGFENTHGSFWEGDGQCKIYALKLPPTVEVALAGDCEIRPGWNSAQQTSSKYQAL
jgi:hypothetical protein